LKCFNPKISYDWMYKVSKVKNKIVAKSSNRGYTSATILDMKEYVEFLHELNDEPISKIKQNDASKSEYDMIMNLL
jgi:hypothetical protein